ncbi:MAG: protein kinase [Sandaracinaceae bacterium]|nr:protein kinase [Sandaracinaceae bacterium]
MSAAIPFGPYELVRRLGSGGMAETYLAVRRGPGGFEQHVCVKRILPALESDPELVRMFMEEARLAAQLRHSNITQVVDFGVVSGSHYLALELVDGMDLRALLASLRAEGARARPAAGRLRGHAARGGPRLRAHARARATPGDPPRSVALERAGEPRGRGLPHGLRHRARARRQAHHGLGRRAREGAVHGGRVRAHRPLRCAQRSVRARRHPLRGRGGPAALRRRDGARHAHADQGRAPPAARLAGARGAPALAAIVEQLLVPRPEERFQSAAALLEALAHVAAPPTVPRQLGELVRASSEHLGHSVSVSQPSRTAIMGDLAPPAAYPQVTPASSDAPTRTSDAGSHMAKTTVDASHEAWPGEARAREGWASTDPAQISQHDRPSPYRPPPAAPSSSPPPSVPITRVNPASQALAQPSPASGRGGGFWVALVLGGALAFAAAGAGGPTSSSSSSGTPRDGPRSVPAAALALRREAGELA